MYINAPWRNSLNSCIQVCVNTSGMHYFTENNVYALEKKVK